MATIRLPPDFKEFFKLLNASEIEYLVKCKDATS